MKNRVHIKIEEAIANLISKASPDYRFYGHFYLHINILEKVGMGTAGVTVKNSKMYMYYDPMFIDLLSNEQVMYLLYHEIKHLLYDHVNRSINANYNPKLTNIATDCIINSIIESDFDKSTYTEIQGEVLKPDGTVFGSYPNLKVPKEYKGEWRFESLYRWLDERNDDLRKNSSDDDDKYESDENTDGSKKSNEAKVIDKCLKSGGDDEGFDVHLDGDLSNSDREYIDSVIKGIKARGINSGHFDAVLEKLTVTKKDNLGWIKQQVGTLIGTLPKPSFLRPNRHQIEGKKGRVFKSVEINAILDVSGSMYGYIEKILGNLYQDGITINLILADTEVKKVYKTNSKDELAKIKLTGFGGTELQPAVDYIASNKEMRFNNTVILTDGYCDNLSLDGIKGRKLIITCGIDVVYTGSKTKQIKFEEGDLKK